MLRHLLQNSSTSFRRLFMYSSRQNVFATGPAPPRLPPKEQEEFERLQKASTGAFSTPNTDSSRTQPPIKQSSAKISDAKNSLNASLNAKGNGEELHPDIRRGAKPEFEGERNPKTGEIGGPKNEPLRWGSTGERGDWSYNSRVTDF